jgi:hypothetical protein
MPNNATNALRKYWKPALATGAGGTSLLIWFEETIALGVKFLGVLSLFILAGPIYLLNHLLFKSATLTQNDKTK